MCQESFQAGEGLDVNHPLPLPDTALQAGLRTVPCRGRSCSQPGDPCAGKGSASPITIACPGGSSPILWLLRSQTGSGTQNQPLPFGHFLWVNHRMVGVGRALCGSPSPTPC